MADDDGKRWGTLAEVANAYGVSVDTIRRRMKRGELETRRHQTPQGFKWLAVMPEPQDTAPDAPGSPRTRQDRPGRTKRPRTGLRSSSTIAKSWSRHCGKSLPSVIAR